MSRRPSPKDGIPSGAPGRPPRGETKREAAPGSARGGGRDRARGKPGDEPQRPRPGRLELRFLYEDREILVVEKPAGLPSIAPEGSRARSAYDLVTERIRRKNPRGRAAVVHRLDRDTSGVMVFAATAEAKRTLMEGWNELVEERRYLALVEGELEGESGRIETWLAEAGPSRMRVAEKGEHGALRARLGWQLLRRGAGYSLLDVSLDTGRKHQIRIQLASAGHPVAGDERYGARSDPAGRLMLHARLLAFRHPSTGELLRFESPAPAEFEAALRAPQTWGPPRPEARGKAGAAPRRAPNKGPLKGSAAGSRKTNPRSGRGGPPSASSR